MKQKRARGAQRGNVNARKHGLHSAKAALVEFGRKAIDGRSAVGVALREFRDGILQDLGGNDALSAQQHAVLDIVVRTKLLLDGVDSFILREGAIVNKRKKSLHPVVRERQALADSLVRHLQVLGLERKAAPVIETCPICGVACIERSGRLTCPGCGKFPTFCTCTVAGRSSERETRNPSSPGLRSVPEETSQETEAVE